MNQRTRAHAVTRAVAALAVSGVLVAAAPATAHARPAGHDAIEHEHTVTTAPAEGRFRCGDLVLTADGGTETEIFDGVRVGDVVRIRITRRYDGVTMAGSDGRRYRARAHVEARFVLVAPDFDNPVWGREVIWVRFLGGPKSSPGWLHEVLTIRDGVEHDVVTGPCDYFDEEEDAG
jgi:hypothetical protein